MMGLDRTGITVVEGVVGVAVLFHFTSLGWTR